LTFEGDMTDDRALMTVLRTDKKLAERTFTHWPLDEYVIKRRPTLVAACLTILRGHIVDKNKKAGGYFRFAEWRRLVADSLVGLGLPDPTLSCARVKADDPREEAQREVMRVWAKSIGESEMTTAQALPWVRQAIAEARGMSDADKLGIKSAAKYLKGMVGIKLIGYRLSRRIDLHTKMVFWHAECIEPNSRVEAVESPPIDSAEREFSEIDDLM
jgi:hypothetical protein